MFITENTTVADVEKHPFVGITSMPLFIHTEMDEVPIYDPYTFEEGKKLVMKTRTIDVKSFYGDYNNLVENSKNSGSMVYFHPTEDGKIVHKKPLSGSCVRMAQVKLTNYEFNKKCNETLNIAEKSSKNKYSYLLIR